MYNTVGIQLSKLFWKNMYVNIDLCAQLCKTNMYAELNLWPPSPIYENMRKSNWIIPPKQGWTLNNKENELPPPREGLYMPLPVINEVTTPQ